MAPHGCCAAWARATWTGASVRWAGRAVLVALLAVSLPAQEAIPAPSESLTVFAAASLQAPFEQLAKRFESQHPGTRVVLNLAGSQQLAAQLALGAEADVFASADERWMDDARDKGLLTGEAAVFAHNTVVAIVPRTNPARITKLQDLAKRGVKLALALESVPVGRYSRESLALLAKLPGYTPDFAARVLANGVTEEENVKAVATKVQLAEVDGGFVYASDVTGSLARYVRVLELPLSARVQASYPIAIIKTSRHAALAQAFVDLVRSSEGQRVLVSHGLQSADAKAPAAR